MVGVRLISLSRPWSELAALCLCCSAGLSAQTPAATPSSESKPAAVTTAPAPPATPAKPKKQEAADARAYHQALAILDPAVKAMALEQFLDEFPDGNYTNRGRDALLNVLVKNFPARVEEIESLASSMIEGSGGGTLRLHHQIYLSTTLSDAGTSGVDTRFARKLAVEAVKHSAEPGFDRSLIKMYASFKIAPPKPDELRQNFRETRAEALAALADADLNQGRQAEASAELNEAYGLDPLESETNALRGRLAHQHGDDAEALVDEERAVLLGDVPERDRAMLHELYRKAHGGSEAGLEAELDERYAALYPTEWTAPPHPAATVGHTVLVELYTGSGCPPCVGGDLAVENVLRAYPRSEVVALALDQHIPEPDPLSNPDTIARAKEYGVASTPSYVVDGSVLPLYGGPRARAERLYGELDRFVAAQLAIATGATLSVQAAANAPGRITAEARVVVPGMAEIEKDEQLAAAAMTKAEAEQKAAEEAEKAASGPAAKKPGAKTKKPAASPSTSAAKASAETPNLVVNFALVEDDVRYSGENGVRFHRMVVRALARPAGEGFPVKPGASAEISANFDPPAISRRWSEYLTKYETSNERFGKIEFLSKDTSMQPNHLGVAAWIEDTGSHRILNAAFVPVSGDKLAAVDGTSAERGH